MTIGAARPLSEMLEKEWDARLFGSQKGLATMLGWRSYHTLRSKGSRSGFPDRVLWKGRVVFVELKRERVSAIPVSEPQRHMLDQLALAGAEVYLWRPSDEDEIARILGRPWRFVSFDATAQEGPWLRRDDGVVLRPGSAWVPRVGRADGDGA